MMRSLALHFAGILTVLILLIWFSRAVGFMKYITENGVEIKQFFYLFVLILPWMASYIIPISLFVAVLVCFSRFLANNEITIFKSCGLTNQQIARPGTIFAIFITLFCYLNSFFITPYANRQFRISRNQIYSSYKNISFNPQTFENFNKTTIYSQNRDQENLYGIFIHNACAENFAITLTAKSGKLKVDGSDVLLYLKNGTLQRQNCENKLSEILTFDNYVFNLNESQKEVVSYNWKPNELYFLELFSAKDGLDEITLRKIRNEIGERILDPLMCLVFTALAICFLLRGHFHRNGNWQAVFLSLSIAVVYILCNILAFQLAEKFGNLFFLPYLNSLLFLVSSVFLLKPSQFKK